MSESFPNNNAQKTPKITALSTAFPMHFESSSIKPAKDAQANQANPTREPHRHDAGE